MNWIEQLRVLRYKWPASLNVIQIKQQVIIGNVIATVTAVVTAIVIKGTLTIARHPLTLAHWEERVCQSGVKTITKGND